MPGLLPLLVKLENAAPPVKIGKGKMSYWLLSFFIYGTGDTISALRSFLKRNVHRMIKMSLGMKNELPKRILIIHVLARGVSHQLFTTIMAN